MQYESNPVKKCVRVSWLFIQTKKKNNEGRTPRLFKSEFYSHSLCSTTQCISCFFSRK